MSFKVRGRITKIDDVLTGNGPKGQWKKVSFLLDSGQQYNNVYSFEVRGVEKVDKFLQYNSVGKEVDVSFNVNTREYQDKFYTSLQAWKVFKAEELSNEAQQPDRDLSFI